MLQQLHALPMFILSIIDSDTLAVIVGIIVFTAFFTIINLLQHYRIVDLEDHAYNRTGERIETIIVLETANLQYHNIYDNAIREYMHEKRKIISILLNKAKSQPPRFLVDENVTRNIGKLDINKFLPYGAERFPDKLIKEFHENNDKCFGLFLQSMPLTGKNNRKYRANLKENMLTYITLNIKEQIAIYMFYRPTLNKLK